MLFAALAAVEEAGVPEAASRADLLRDQIGGERRQLIELPVRPATLALDVLTFGIPISASPRRNAAVSGANASGKANPRNPITGNAGYCARATTRTLPRRDRQLRVFRRRMPIALYQRLRAGRDVGKNITTQSVGLAPAIR